MPLLTIRKLAPTGALALAVMFGLSCSDDNPAAPAPADTSLRITDLRDTLRTGNSLELLWTAPGSDSTVIESYEVRYSTEPYDSANWWDSLAMPLTLDRLLAKPGETQRMTITELTRATQYSFACHARLADGQQSALSNVHLVTTSNILPPEPIHDLRFDQWIGRQAVLKWTIPSDSESGPVTRYDIRYATSIDSLKYLWDRVGGRVAVDHRGSPGDSVGTRTPDLPGKVFYSGIRAADANSMWSALGNCVMIEAVGTPNGETSHFTLARVSETELVYGYTGGTAERFNRTVLRASRVRFSETDWYTIPEIQIELPVADPKERLLNNPTLYASIPATSSESLFVTIRSMDNRGAWNNGRIAAVWPIPDTRSPLCPRDLEIRREGDSITGVWSNDGDSYPAGLDEYGFPYASPNYGNVYAQELRIASDSLTQEEWEDAETWPTLPPVAANVLEEYTRSIPASTESVFVALRFSDEAGNWTPFAMAWSLPADTTPPGPITDLSVRYNTGESSFTLFYTGTGDDGDLGFTSRRDFLFLTNPNATHDDWMQATTMQQTLALPAGTPDSLKITYDFDPSTTYYFRMRSHDESGNVSELSNIASGSTPASRGVTVPDDYETIHEALDNTIALDTIFVRCGTYSVAERIRFADRILVGAGAACTKLEGDGAGSVLLLLNAASASGFTITGGSEDSAAVYLFGNGKGALTDCIVEDNPGLGVRVDGNAHVIGCDLLRNAGGGLEGNGSVKNCRVRENNGFGTRTYHGHLDSLEVSGNHGVGVWISGGTLANTEVTGNHGVGLHIAGPATASAVQVAENDSVGVAMDGNGRLLESDIHHNGLHGARMSGPGNLMQGCRVHENGGDGVLVNGELGSRGDARITSSRVYQNPGFGIRCEGTVSVTQTTIFKNGEGGIASSGEASIDWCTIAENGNRGVLVDPSSEFLKLQSSVVAFNQNAIENAADSVVIECTILYETDFSQYEPILAVLDALPFGFGPEVRFTWRDPLFCDPAADDYSIAKPGPWLGGGWRRDCGHVGAGEYCDAGVAPAVVFDVPDQFRSLAHALFLAAPEDTIEIAPNAPHEFDLEVSRTVVIRGAAEGAGNTIIDLQQRGRFLHIRNGNTTLERLTIQNGWIWSDRAPPSGGAILVDKSGTLRATDCRFEDNRAYWRGGAVNSIGSNLMFERCVFLRNRGDQGGAIAVQNIRGQWPGPEITANGCLFARNHANREGACFDGNLGSGHFTHSTFVSNIDQLGSHFTDAATVTHCILASGISNGYEGRYPAPPPHFVATISCNNYFDLPPGVSFDTDPTLMNFSLDPLFCDPENDNFTLFGHSPCVDREGCGQVGAYGTGCWSK